MAKINSDLPSWPVVGAQVVISTLFTVIVLITVYFAVIASNEQFYQHQHMRRAVDCMTQTLVKIVGFERLYAYQTEDGPTSIESKLQSAPERIEMLRDLDDERNVKNQVAIIQLAVGGSIFVILSIALFGLCFYFTPKSINAKGFSQRSFYNGYMVCNAFFLAVFIGLVFWLFMRFTGENYRPIDLHRVASTTVRRSFQLPIE